MVKNKRTTTTTGRELFASAAKVKEEGEVRRGCERRKDSENEETKEPRRSWRWRLGARFIGEFKRTRTLDITQHSPDVD